MEVPVIDIGPFRARLASIRAQLAAPGSGHAPLPEEARRVVRQWREAFATYGFCQVVGHGVPNDTIEAAYKTARSFFSLPVEEKLQCQVGKEYGSASGGFTAQGRERVGASASEARDGQPLGGAKARPPDRVESMVLFGRDEDVIPASVKGYKETMHLYYAEMVQLLRILMALTACSLDLPCDHFDPFYRESHDALRLAYYPAFEAGEEPLHGQLRYAEHTDYTGFTILWQDHNSDGPQTATEGLKPPPGGLQARQGSACLTGPLLIVPLRLGRSPSTLAISYRSGPMTSSCPTCIGLPTHHLVIGVIASPW
eukprot:TRINITY_DN35276_c0_g1_i1.p1 TRINITY_DN35276_c0_g1~~TRINITY_DN35276_c0_g1_i1.p1  ORF type:complete len:312 (-),score=37.75 TRINITY_DN35276_c0_g1_i1:141-1076(-)